MYAYKSIMSDKRHKSHKISSKRATNLSRRSWSRLTPRQKTRRITSLKVLSLVREGKSLVKWSREFGISLDIVKSHLKSAIRKKGKRWVAKAYDMIQRNMVISEKGESISIIITNSEDASLIGRYFNDVKKFLVSGDVSLLKKYKGKKIKDSRGKVHTLETNPQALYDIEEAREDEEFFEIYEDD